MGRKLDRIIQGPDDEPIGYMFACPGCGEYHAPHVEKPNSVGARWTFNGDLERPTFSPSILMRHEVGGKTVVCHSFVRDGRIQFLSDCTHDLRGQTVDLPDIE